MSQQLSRDEAKRLYALRRAKPLLDTSKYPWLADRSKPPHSESCECLSCKPPKQARA